jgi:protein SCO1
MTRLALPAALATLAIGASGCGGGGTLAPQPKAAAAPKSDFAGHALSGPGSAADFALRDQQGRLIRLSGQRGKLVLVTFLYTHCTDICPLIADHLNQALLDLYHQRSSVRVLAVSVDPVGDTPRAVRAYVREHRLLPEFRFLTGTRVQLAKVWQAYNVSILQRNPESIGHSGYIYLLDRRGKPRVFYSAKATAAQVAHDLRVLLRSSY